MPSNYRNVHMWLQYNFGKANQCESQNCSSTSNIFQWALIKGKTHAKERSNYRQLCKLCHARYDMKDSCNNGHQYTKENTRYREKGHRICRECQRMYVRNFKRRAVTL